MISLLMPTIRRREEIHRLLDTLEMQSSMNFELIIVDQNRDGLLEPILRRLSLSGISHKHILTEKKGLSIARNIGLPHARGEIIGYPDDDCWYEEGVIADVAEILEKNPDIDGIVGRWCEMDSNYQDSYFLDMEQWRRFKIGISAFSSCLFMRRELVERVAGFDDRLGVPLWFGAGEETDFVMRCLNAGAKIQYVPGIGVHHPVKSLEEGATDLKEIRKRSRGTGALYRKHRLSWLVISRGLLSPLLRSLAPSCSLRRILANFMTVLGRIEGVLCWKDFPDIGNPKKKPE